MKRIAIYFFFDRDGQVDSYVEKVLSSLKPYIDYLLVVCNGKLATQGKELLDHYSDKLLIRKNEGFDVWAYKDAMDSMGWDRLTEYDELVLMNYTIMGPVYPLSEMFDAMDKRPELDFWGITKCFREDSPEAQKLWNCPYGYVPEHIQSSFTVFRKRLMLSNIFQSYWNNMPAIKSYYESGGRHEQFITKYLADSGFKWDCYTNYDDMDPKLYGCCPLITHPLAVVKELRSPFFKRRSFFTPKLENPSSTPVIKDFLSFLKDETSYDTELLYPNLIRGCNQRDLMETLQWVHILRDTDIETKPSCCTSKIAIFANLKNAFEKEALSAHLARFSSITDVFVTESAQSDTAPLWTGAEADFSKYDYICLIASTFYKKPSPSLYSLIRQNYYIDNLLDSPAYLLHAISLLDACQYEGMLTVPGDFLGVCNWETHLKWREQFEAAKVWLSQNHMSVPLDPHKPPVMIENGCALIKVSALGNLKKKIWSSDSFNALPFLLPLHMQHNGFLPAYLIRESNIINNATGLESFVEWMPEIKAARETYYKEYYRYVKEWENEFEGLKKAYQIKEDDIQKLLTYTAELEKNICQKETNIQELLEYTAALEKADARKEQDIEEMKAYIQELEQASFLSQPVSSLSAKLLHIFHHSRRNK